MNRTLDYSPSHSTVIRPGPRAVVVDVKPKARAGATTALPRYN